MKKGKKLLLSGFIAFFVGTAAILNEKTDILGFFLIFAGLILLIVGVLFVLKSTVQEMKSRFSARDSKSALTPQKISANTPSNPEKKSSNNVSSGRYGLNLQKIDPVTDAERILKLKDFTVVDVETTGLNSQLDEIIEISILSVVNNKLTEEFTTLVNPGRHIDPGASKVNHIYDSDVASAPSPAKVAPQVWALMCGRPVVGHNVKFDLNFISKWIEMLGESADMEYIDTYPFSRKMLPGMPNYKLQTLVDELGIREGIGHRASTDTHATLKLFEICRDHLAIQKKVKNEGKAKNAKNKTNSNVRNTGGVQKSKGESPVSNPQEYRQFTTPSELQKAVNTLSGMIAGLSSDNNISESEINELVHWCTLHENLRSRHPFSELLPLIDKALADGVIDEEEQKDILWLCSNCTSSSKYYDVITSSIQFLNGLLHGSMADGELSDSEIIYLYKWLEENHSLSGTYPYDELYSLTNSILEDKKITQIERERLMAFASNLIEFKDSYNLVESDFVKLREAYSVQGICNSGVSKKTDYLVVGNGGNPCWAYSCYGRKIEEGLELRKNGAKLQIISEDDFWAAVHNTQAVPL